MLNSRAMKLSKVCLLLILSIIHVHSESEVYDANYCIFSVANTCNYSHTTIALRNLNDLAFISESRVKVYFTAENHYLTENFNFSDTVSEITLQGSENANSGISKILCQNAGLYISEMVRVHIVNLNFEKCTRNNSHRSLPIGLLISEVDYIELNHITISNSTGRGLYTLNCKEQVIVNSEFQRNMGGNAKIMFDKSNSTMSLKIASSAFVGGSNTGGLCIFMPTQNSVSNITISNSRFADNIGTQGSHIQLNSAQQVSARICISNCTFYHKTQASQPSSGNTFGAYVENGNSSSKSQMEVYVQDSNFTNNNMGGLQIIHSTQISITNCLINENSGTGLSVILHLGTEITMSTPNANINILNSSFTRNSKALYLGLKIQNDKRLLKTVISNCKFSSHTVLAARAVAQIEGNIGLNKYTRKNQLNIETSTFEHNSGSNGDCSSLHVTNMNNMTLDGVDFTNNNCTGITSIASNITIANKVIMNNNHGYYGGAMHLESKEIASRNKFSSLKFNFSAQLLLLNNKAMTYGGGIWTDEACNYRNEKYRCFIKFQSHNSVERIKSNASLVFRNNTAQNGGDSIFGGCLTNCSLHFRNKVISVNASDRNNVFWNFTSIESEKQSSIAGYPQKVAFCDLERCSSNHSVTVYRGQQFFVPLMIVDEACKPTVSYITANILNTNNSFRLKDVPHHQSKKNCANFEFSLTGSLSESSTRIELLPQTHSNDISPTFLDVYFTSCPAGFKSNRTTCVCHDLLKDHGFTCFSKNMALEIPGFTWIGEYDGSITLNQFCKFCIIKEQTVVNIKENSNMLCTAQRTGTLCGSCSTNTTLLLGGYWCGECTSVFHGIILTFVFVVLGIALILVLFFLNITVSNGVLSAVIFYCNVIHSNSDIFLPIDYNSNQTSSSLQHTVQYLSSFQAWINLDFGIKTCYFNGYNTYISTWMQFVFPLYIWLLILLVVFASKYSSKVSKVTTSNTVPVLATLLLLSYAKLLITCLEVVSFARLERLDSKNKSIVWFLDGNIKYFSKEHAPLLLMSAITMMFYIIPFTLLILFGPLLQAKSEYKFLRWINKLKPLLDAFYGPYTSGYRYWAGILLVARSVVFIYTIYSLGDITFKLLSTVALSVFLFIILLFIGQREKTSIYTASFKSYLEWFVFGNLTLFSIISAYHWSTDDDTLHKKQVLAVIMVGQIFITFCGILLHSTLLKYKLTSNVVTFVVSCLKKNRNEGNASTPTQDHSTLEGCTTTHSTLAMTELREPLLHIQKTE